MKQALILRAHNYADIEMVSQISVRPESFAISKRKLKVARHISLCESFIIEEIKLSTKFAGDLRKSLFSNLLNGKYEDRIREDIRDFKENIKKLRENPNYYKALSLLVELVMTNSQRRPLSRQKKTEYDKHFSIFYNKFGDEGFKTKDGEKQLLDIVNQFATLNRKKAIQKVSDLLRILIDRNITISDWIKNLHDLARVGKTEILGDKGRDNYLRDFGYFDRAPMDIHEGRFIIRTGIYHYYAKREESDPQERRHLQAALVSFCEKQLKGFEVEEINDCLGQRLDLGKHAGMVDLFVWYYCAKDRYCICGKKPKCLECALSASCMFRLLSMST